MSVGAQPPDRRALCPCRPLASTASHLRPAGMTSAHHTVLAFDFGDKRVGVACGNTLLRQAQPLKTLAMQGEARFAAIAALIREWQPAELVVGVPFHPDGAEHDNTRRARRFARQLAGRFNLPVREVDERYTTTEAHSQGARGDALDAASAAIILAQHFEHTSTGTAP